MGVLRFIENWKKIHNIGITGDETRAYKKWEKKLNIAITCWSFGYIKNLISYDKFHNFMIKNIMNVF